MNHNTEFSAGNKPLANPGRVNLKSFTDIDANDNAAAERTIGQVQSVLQPLAQSTDGTDGTNFTFNGAYLGSGDGDSPQSFTRAAEMQLEGGA